MWPYEEATSEQGSFHMLTNMALYGADIGPKGYHVDSDEFIETHQN